LFQLIHMVYVIFKFYFFIFNRFHNDRFFYNIMTIVLFIELIFDLIYQLAQVIKFLIKKTVGIFDRIE